MSYDFNPPNDTALPSPVNLPRLRQMIATKPLTANWPPPVAVGEHEQNSELLTTVIDEANSTQAQTRVRFFPPFFMFRAASRRLFRISRAPSTRCATQLSAPLPRASFASTVGKRGWWQRAWFRKDGTPSSKRKGALYGLFASLALVPIPVLAYAFVLYEDHSFVAWSLVQCYRIDARYDKVNWDDLDSVVDYFRDVSFSIRSMPQDQVESLFDHIKLWAKEDPKSSHTLLTKRIFTRAAIKVHFLLMFRSGKTKVTVGAELIDRSAPITVDTLEDLGLVETGFLVVRILQSALAEWARIYRMSGGGDKLLELDSSEVERDKADHVADWETVE
ncbi:hypothetical protein BDZ89DRAFT_1163391 [Hymenopellis radicata]|nr:hypothetical protein BDZ89DRAFT_1163391 [Hymenopellis radicata]